MASFGTRSKEVLGECHPAFREIFEEVVKEYDCAAFEGYRGPEAQDEHFRTGLSNAKWPESKHNKLPSLAIHVAPYPIDWANTKRFYHFAGFAQAMAITLGYKLVWGGDWDSDRDLDDQTLFDLAHFELTIPEKEGD